MIASPAMGVFMSNAHGAVIFIYDGLNGIGFRIPEVQVGAPRDQIAKRAAILEGLGGGEVAQFQRRGTPAEPSSYLTTENPAVIAYVRGLKKEHPIREDLSLIPIRCPYCEFALPSNTQEDREALSIHLSNDCQGMTDADVDDGDAK